MGDHGTLLFRLIQNIPLSSKGAFSTINIGIYIYVAVSSALSKEYNLFILNKSQYLFCQKGLILFQNSYQLPYEPREKSSLNII